VASALIRAFEITDKEILARCQLEGGRSGATGVVVVRIGETLYAAHCGDSRAVMCRGGEPLRLTEDHKPNLPRERQRVEALGGRVDFARCWRVIVDPGDGRPASGLAVSRSFGDPDFKQPLHLVTATPDVMRERLAPEDSFFVLASDGLWDVMSDKEACDIVAARLNADGVRHRVQTNGSHGNGDEERGAAVRAAEALVQASLEAGTMDNVTAVVGILHWS
jgi:serine/threonine protein phosphatase PrpC